MSIRFVVENFTKFLLSVNKRHKICHTNLKCLVSNNEWARNNQIRNLTNTNFRSKKLGLLQSVIQSFKTRFKKHKLKATGYYLYECVADQVDYSGFAKELRMADTFTSWFLVTELHVWMLMAYILKEPTTGRTIRNNIVEAMWNDVSARSKKLDEVPNTVIKGQIQVLSEEFQAALVNYDEGLLSSDIVLAGAIWRRLLKRDPSYTATDIEAMVKYIRQTMDYLDTYHIEEFSSKKLIQWIPLSKIYSDLSS